MTDVVPIAPDEMPVMPEGWRFVSCRSEPDRRHDGALSLISIARSTILEGRALGRRQWRRVGVQTSIRWNRNGDDGRVPIVELRELHPDGSHATDDPGLELSMAWGGEYSMRPPPKDERALALRMLELAYQGIMIIGRQGERSDPEAENLFDALRGLMSAECEGDGWTGGTFVLRLPTPWSPLVSMRYDASRSRRMNTDEQERAITAVSPRVVAVEVDLLSGGRRTCVTLQPYSWVGGRSYDPLGSIRAIASLPDVLRAAFEADGGFLKGTARRTKD